MPHLNLKLLGVVIAIARETLDRLIQLLGSLAQVEKDNATIHKVVEQKRSTMRRQWIQPGTESFPAHSMQQKFGMKIISS